ncbi:Hypothetical_protein [Hexamita inflata]|uniref:Hypothetical_protein n=1 Tax=Hexamita inflata TaxID=28002 RepID=A0AA86P7Z6_9EUKA|nr:Hypothetical protein HINF_LOCUS19720 [Hexamita inflata]CAI9970287.1 Hypothetical protein HINF_LOCUS57932 [Hexamita inflata]
MLDDKKITQKTSNAEAQSENEKKTEVSQKAEPTKNIEEKAPDKTKPKDAQKQKEKSPRLQVTRSKDHQKAPIQRKVSSKGNLEKERGQITCLRKACQIIAKRWSK